MFWYVYFLDRNLIYPIDVEDIIPVWFNHCLHTIPVIIVFLHLVVVEPKSKPLGMKASICIQSGIHGIYLAVLVFLLMSILYYLLYNESKGIRKGEHKIFSLYVDYVGSHPVAVGEFSRQYSSSCWDVAIAGIGRNIDMYGWWKMSALPIVGEYGSNAFNRCPYCLVATRIWIWTTRAY